MRIIERPRPPRGLRRLLLRLPVPLFRAGLGWLFAGRLVLIEHVGRRTGVRRVVVVEVVDRDRRSGAVTVASGFGARADWYRNLRSDPRATVRLRGRRIPVIARPLSAGDAEAVMVRYGRRHPRAAPRVARFMGFAVDGGDADYAAIGQTVPFLVLVPARPPKDQR